ncbi:oligosaccharide flippase family protein [Leuconostoc mesenteroides]|uniref:Wzx n=1 Tax=Leuconostoc mesenteroides TaxID=1245 RepID=A0A7S6VG06_LEUME|nr:oligosaccharide flippase family protein [Leuconostoc mesenteroides]KMY78761.1 hypothetical protein WZ79_00405 [Leuconostoc mesenteroides subsp. mesenteroides]MCI2120652.1 oligosaccharide flippase family protein [Leuconostoc mesenteroides]MDP0487286.1 oligosaccharide flippase family protein [Leuconostoc mesenteroides]QOW37938.1 Wzx [Leuconostoc mesenteroides]
MKKNFINYTAYQLVTFLLPILLNAYISRTLGVSNIGMYNLSLSITTYFSIFLKLGIDLYGSREVAYARTKGKSGVAKIFCGVFQIQITTGIVVISIFIFGGYWLAHVFALPYQLLLIQGISILTALLDISWLVIGLEKFNVIILRNTLVKLLSIVLVVLFVKNESQLNLYAVIIVLTNLLATVSVWFMMKEYVEIKFRTRNYHYFKPISVLFLPIIATSLFTQLDTILVAHFSSFKEVGFYVTALSIIAIPKILVSSFGSVVMPHMSKQVGDMTQSEETDIIVDSIIYWMIFSGLVVVFILFNSYQIVNIMYGHFFNKSAYLLKILVIMFPFYVLGNILRTQVLIPKRNDKPYVVSIVVASIVNISGNILLVPILGAQGGITAVILTEIIIFIIEFMYTIKMNFWRKVVTFFIKWIIYLCCMIGLLYMVHTITNHLNFNLYVIMFIDGVILLGVTFKVFKTHISSAIQILIKK